MVWGSLKGSQGQGGLLPLSLEGAGLSGEGQNLSPVTLLHVASKNSVSGAATSPDVRRETLTPLFFPSSSKRRSGDGR